MALGTVGQPICEEISERFLRVTWTYTPATPTDSLEGFKLKWGETLPSGWSVPPALDLGLLPYTGTSPRTYGVLLDRDEGAVAWWETFEEYALGSGGTLDKGGVIWDGAWVILSPTALHYDDFESYATGGGATLLGGSGWLGPWLLS